MTIITPLPGRRISAAQISRLRRVATVLAVAIAVTTATSVMSVTTVTTVMAADRDRVAAPPRPSSAQRSPTIVDRAVVPAGGSRCQQCGPGGCSHGHGGANRHHRDCRDGACAPYCPVRPSTFGFYGTQWRRWPGQGVVPVSDERAATPATPPTLEVPGVDEESRGPKPPELPEPATDSSEDPADKAKAPPQPERQAEPEASPPEEAEPKMEREPAPRQEPRSPAAKEPAADDERLREEPKTPPEPREVPRGEEKPAPAAEPVPSAPRPEDENLFDGSAVRKVRRKILVSAGSQPAVSEPAGSVQPAVHRDDQTVESSPPLRRVPLTVPRVPFDPRAELERMRQQR